MSEGQRILVVDDESGIRTLLRRLFEKKGYAVGVAGTAAEALEQAGEGFYNLAVLDLKLPDATGLELLTPLKELHPDMEVIMLTGYASMETAIEALNQGASAYISKPVNTTELLSRVQEVLNRQGLVFENRRLYEETKREVAERKRAEAELRTAKEAAEAANRTKSQFLASVSHELRTPLNAIIGFADVLSEGAAGELEERQAKYVGNILTAGERLLALINDVLDVAKIDAGESELDLSSFKLKELVTSSLTMVRDAAEKRSLSVESFSEDGGQPIFLTADAPKLKQVLFNLLSNAVKFTPEGGRITVTTRCCPAPGMEEAAEGNAGDWVEISVVDTGIGLSTENVKRIFGDFEQADSSHTRRYQGTGLGLALSRRLVGLHGGRLSVDSDGEGCGSTFRLIVPRDQTMRVAATTVGDATDGRSPVAG
ncbi:MAG: hybrid sensor histidine kinase/response regulator [Lentisphaerae bacterium]|jgi:signal transduction histidine kinase|nr:hybrid sensor histidine kinase/response regulator [Lentisphaerota bacterium]MBT4819379.1 hybrid sensor histidine kinase/response regulator [Lentisphaerota bacterium]MBT5607147.1 hybrid sensor histidine kinase/response regulator [Lentisphaerota bacterium]MBT7059477.1 hybrid sensor histidine kinase/response regulator [Lentisphaerota bacterium]MBT7840314.1 hybrid sensor histidine kinase/response regulator [Lentisphaerota bacterium]